MEVAMAKVKKKKRSKAPLVLFILFLIFIVAPIITFYALFYDPNTKKVVIQEDFTMLNVGNRIIVDSLDYAPTDAQIKLQISENDVDNVLHLAMDKVTQKIKYVKKAYMYTKGNNYNFYVDVDGVIIKTRVKVTTELQVSDDNDNFVFKVKDIALGRLNGIMTPGKMLIERFVTDEKINEVLKATGLDVTFDREQYAIIYPKASLINDLGKLTQSETMGLYFDVMQTMLRDNMVSFNFEGDAAVEGIVDLTRLQTNELVTDTNEQIRIHTEDVQEIRDKLVTLIEHGDIDRNDKNLPYIAFDYLFNGWGFLNDESKAALADVDFSYVDIDDKEAYQGFGLYDAEARLIDKMKETVNAHDLIDKTLDPRYKELCTLSEDAINEYIASRNIVGYTSLLHRDSPEGYKVNYITIENFYLNIYKNSLNKNIAEMVCKIDVNGYVTSLTFETQMSDGGFSDNKLVFEVKDIKFGQSDAANLKEEFFDIIFDALDNGEDQSFTADKENYTISVDFSDIMQYARDEAEQAVETYSGSHYDLESYFSMDNLTFEVLGSSREDVGAMKLSLIEPIDY